MTLAQTRATLPPLQSQLTQTRNQLAALVGRLPSQDGAEAVRADLAASADAAAGDAALETCRAASRRAGRRSPAAFGQRPDRHGPRRAIPRSHPERPGGLSVRSTRPCSLPCRRFCSLGANVAGTAVRRRQLHHKKQAAIAAYDASRRAVPQHRAAGVRGRCQRLAGAGLRRRGAAREPRRRTSAADSLNLAQRATFSRRHHLSHPAQRRAAIPVGAHQPGQGPGDAFRRHRRPVPGARRRLVEPHDVAPVNGGTAAALTKAPNRTHSFAETDIMWRVIKRVWRPVLYLLVTVVVIWLVLRCRNSVTRRSKDFWPASRIRSRPCQPSRPRPTSGSPASRPSAPSRRQWRRPVAGSRRDRRVDQFQVGRRRRGRHRAAASSLRRRRSPPAFAGGHSRAGPGHAMTATEASSRLRPSARPASTRMPPI